MSSDPSDGRNPDELFENYANIARRAVFRALPTGEAHRYLYDLLPDYLLRPSKYLRPVLCLAACCAFGGSVEMALPAAVAFELIHTAFLIHDDIQDDSVQRRGKPSLNELYGVPLALNIGDMFVCLATQEFLRAAERLRPSPRRTVIDEFRRMVTETIEGQSMELGWQYDDILDVTTADYLHMAMKKTSWYSMIEPLYIGAIIGSGGVTHLDRFIHVGGHLGAMFQIANDLAGFDNPDHDDIREGKRTLLLIYFLSRASKADRRRAADSLALPRSERCPEDVDWLHDRIVACGGVEFARNCLDAMTDAALQESERAFGSLPASPDRSLLLSLTTSLRDGG